MPLIVFDLDGTILDSRRDLADSTNDVIESFGGTALPVDQIAGMIGEGARVLIKRAREAAHVDANLDEALDRFRTFYDRRLVAHTVPYPGISDVICSAAERAPLAVLTNKPESFTRRLLDYFELTPSFRWVIGGDSPFARKPDPAALVHLMGEAAVSRAQTLLVGDSMIDAETARRAGVKFCLARYGYGHLRGEMHLAGEELTADSPADIGRAIGGFLDHF